MSDGHRVKVGVVQMHCDPEPEPNVQRALAGVTEAARKGAEVVCLPELFRTRYFCQVEDAGNFALAEPVPGPTSELFERLAAQLNVAIIVSLFEQRAPGLYHNTAAVVDGERGYLGLYRKMHIPDDPRYYEKFYFTPGDLGFKVFESRAAKLGVLVCWDQWYPEAARLTALRGAEILFYPTAIGWHPGEKAESGASQHGAWEVMQRSHAVANGCYVVAVNRVGFEPDPSADGPSAGIEFWGQTLIVAPNGQVMYRGPVGEEIVQVVDLDLGAIATARNGWPFLRDRRIDAYQELQRRFIDER